MIDGAGTTDGHRGASGSLADVGSMLRDRRVELGRDIDTVSRQTHIKRNYLKAIEEGRRRDLPGTAYTIGFVRTYADYLGFDGNRLVNDFHAQLSGTRDRVANAQAAAPAPELPRLTTSPVAIAGAGLLLALVGFFLWGYLSDDSGKPQTASVEDAQDLADADDTPVPEGPADSTAADPAAADSAVVGGDAGAVPDPMTAADGTGSGQSAAVASPVEDQLPPPEADPAEPTAEQDPEQVQEAAVETAAAEGAGKVVLRAKLESWVQVTNAKNESIFSRVLRAGETYTVPNEKGLLLTTGNAGGVEILLDGKKLKSLGSVGLVRRDVPLDAKKLKDGSAFKPASAAPSTP